MNAVDASIAPPDVLVIGCGPAGLLVAAQLLASGHRVVAVDRGDPPVDAALALTRPGLAALREAGWQPPAESVQLSRLVLTSGRETVALDQGWEAVCVTRSRLLADLMGLATERGLRVESPATAVGPLWEERRVVGLRVRTPSGEIRELAARAVVDASGPASVLAAGLGQLLPRRGARYCRSAARFSGEGATREHTLVVCDGDWVQLLPEGEGMILAATRWASEDAAEPALALERCLTASAPAARLGAVTLVARTTGSQLRAQAGEGWLAVGEAAGSGGPGLPAATSTGLATAACAAWEVGLALDHGHGVGPGQLGATTAMTRQAVNLESLLHRSLARAAAVGMLTAATATATRRQRLTEALQGEWTARRRLGRMFYLWWLDRATRREVKRLAVARVPGRERL